MPSPTGNIIDIIDIYQKKGKQIELVLHPHKVNIGGLAENEICFDSKFNYPDFENYHGPVNLSHIVQFNNLVKKAHGQFGKVTVHTVKSLPPSNNCFLLLGFFLLLEEGFSPEKATSLLKKKRILLEPFLGIGNPPNPAFAISHLDILRGFKKMIQAEPSILTDFKVEEYDRMEDPNNGDASWIIPKKILALAGPKPPRLSPENLLEFFSPFQIKTIIRLNRKHYTQKNVPGIALYNLYMKDGASPSPMRWRQFQKIMKARLGQGPVAVHCRAGLGRTGCLIGGFLMKTFGLEANEAIGFMRVMRPGSVLGDQPIWLKSIENKIE